MHYRQPAVAHREGRDQVPVRHADVSPSSVAATASGRMGDVIGEETLSEIKGVIRRAGARRRSDDHARATGAGGVQTAARATRPTPGGRGPSTMHHHPAARRGPSRAP